MKLVIVSGKNKGEWVLDKKEIIIGRGKPADVNLTLDDRVSRGNHAKITYENGQYRLEDLGSKRGTFIEGERITKKTHLPANVKFTLGETILVLKEDGATTITGSQTVQITQAGRDVYYEKADVYAVGANVLLTKEQEVTLNDGDERNFCFLSIDVIDHSTLASKFNPADINHTLINLREWLNSVVTNKNGKELSWAGDGGIFYFLQEKVTDKAIDNAGLSSMDILNNLANFNELHNQLYEQGKRHDIRLRLGIDFGRTIYRKEPGNWYSEALNTAVKIQKMALPNSILITQQVYRNLADSRKKLFAKTSTMINNQVIYIFPEGEIKIEETEKDLEFMKLAIEEARKSKQEKGKTPLYVGAVVVKDGVVLGKAHRGEISQGDHAEYTLLERKLPNVDLSGAILYTTLEPCTTRNHPKVPCAKRIVERRLGRVVVGIIDPNPDICGKGIWILTENRVIVEHFPHKLQEEIRLLNQEFIKEQLENAKQGGKLKSDGSLKPEVLKERPEMNQTIKVIDGQNITIIQAWGDVYYRPSGPTQPFQPSLHNQTPPEENFVGRVEMLKTITQWYQSPDVRIGALIGWGGVGKSALARKWYDLLVENNIQPDGIFWWGFYGHAYLDSFLDELLKYLSQGRIDLKEIKGSWEKIERIKEFSLDAEYLIILDGLEEMQKGEEMGAEFGSMAHKELTELLKFLVDTKGRGLCLITTRYPLTDIKNYEGRTYQKIEVERLETEDARALFSRVGVKGEQEQIDKVIAEYDGHALSLTLLSKYLVEDSGGDIKKAKEIPPFHSDKEAGGKAHRILLWYEKQLTEEQRAFMKIFSLFRRAVVEEDFEGVFRAKMETRMNQSLMDMSGFSFKRMVDNLCARRLIAKGQEGKSEDLHSSSALEYKPLGLSDTYTTHPLIKGYFEYVFEEEDKRLCHKRLYHYFGEIATPEPKGLEEMQPLFEQVYHGCQAGLYQEAFEDVYWQKVQRGEEEFLVKKLGAWETNISLIQNFFANGDFQKEPLVTEIGDKSYLINEAGVSMMMLGRLKDAEGLYKKAIELYISQKDWENASVGYRNLDELQIRTGNLLEAKESSEEAIRLSRKAKDVPYELISTAYLAYTLFLLGEMDKAGKEFEKAGELQRKADPSKRYLYSNRGIWYTDFLLSQRRIQEALDVTNENLRICKRNNQINDINLCHRSLAAIFRHLKDFKEAEKNTLVAVEGARKTGRQDIAAEALIELARIKLEQCQYPEAESVLAQALQICQRCGYRLYEADAELILAKVMECSVRDTARIDTVDALQKAKSLAQSALSKANEMHYHLPKVEASQLLEKIKS